MWHFWAKPAVLSVNCYFLPLTRFIFKFFHCKYIFTAQKKEVKDVFHFSRKNKLDWKTNCNGKSWTQQTRHILFRLTINSTVRYSHWSSNFFIFNSCIIFCMFPSLRLFYRLHEKNICNLIGWEKCNIGRIFTLLSILGTLWLNKKKIQHSNSVAEK